MKPLYFGSGFDQVCIKFSPGFVNEFEPVGMSDGGQSVGEWDPVVSFDAPNFVYDRLVARL